MTSSWANLSLTATSIVRLPILANNRIIVAIIVHAAVLASERTGTYEIVGTSFLAAATLL